MKQTKEQLMSKRTYDVVKKATSIYNRATRRLRVRNRVRNSTVYTSHPKGKEKRIVMFEESKLYRKLKAMSKANKALIPNDKGLGILRKIFG